MKVGIKPRRATIARIIVRAIRISCGGRPAGPACPWRGAAPNAATALANRTIRIGRSPNYARHDPTLRNASLYAYSNSARRRLFVGMGGDTLPPNDPPAGQGLPLWAGKEKTGQLNNRPPRVATAALGALRLSLHASEA